MKSESRVNSVIGCGSRFFNYFIVVRNCENILFCLFLLLVDIVFVFFVVKIFFLLFIDVYYIKVNVGKVLILYINSDVF